MKDQVIIDAFDLIESNGGDFEGAIEEEVIQKAEKILGLAFPPSYRMFISRYGCGDIEGLEIYGIIDDDFVNSSVPDAVWLTLNERSSGLPDTYIIIAGGDGEFYVIDTRYKNSDGESSIFSYEIDGSVIKIAEDFGEYLLAQLKEVIG